MIGEEKAWFGGDRSHIPSWMRFSVSLAVQCFVAVVGAMVIGFPLEALLERGYDNTGLAAYSPAIAFTAFLLGAFVSRRIRKGQAANFVWVIGLLWMMCGMFDSMNGWSASWSPEKTRWGYMLAELFGPTNKCSDSECLFELLFTTPFTASITYSIGAYIRKRQMRRKNLSRLK
jgi:hypothetical protein